MRLNSKQIAEYTGGRIVVEPIDASALMSGISWDSRDIERGWLYVALIGERVDGHGFVEQALRAGAAGALVMHPLSDNTLLLAREMGAAIIEVPNTMSAITDLAREWRRQLRGRVIGLTGSSGKTTTKNLVRDVIAAERSVVATHANQNNELGVPKTILNANPETEVIVVEMGMRGLGQIEELCDLVKPDWGLITNVSECHIELLKTKENIARAKAELFEGLPSHTGTAFVNGSDEQAEFLIERGRLVDRGCTIVCCDGSGGYRVDADMPPWRAQHAVWAEDVTLDGQGRACFTLCARGFSNVTASSEGDAGVRRCACHLGLRGMHNVSNSCIAAAVGLMLGMDLSVIVDALAKSLPESGRQDVVRARRGFTIVDDAYNANPDSMKASLSTFAALDVAGRRYAVLGDMGELGDHSVACHHGVGEFAASLPIEALVCVGKLSRHIAQGALDFGMEGDKIVCVDSVAEAIRELDVLLEPGDALLVKASHAMGLTRVVEGLVN